MPRNPLYMGEFDWSGKHCGGTTNRWSRVRSGSACNVSWTGQARRSSGRQVHDFAFARLIECGHYACAMVGTAAVGGSLPSCSPATTCDSPRRSPRAADAHHRTNFARSRRSSSNGVMCLIPRPMHASGIRSASSTWTAPRASRPHARERARGRPGSSRRPAGTC